MKITVDTNEDSKDDILRVITMLQNYIKEQEVSYDGKNSVVESYDIKGNIDLRNSVELVIPAKANSTAVDMYDLKASREEIPKKEKKPKKKVDPVVEDLPKEDHSVEEEIVSKVGLLPYDLK